MYGDHGFGKIIAFESFNVPTQTKVLKMTISEVKWQINRIAIAFHKENIA
jgi:hypothetical protein